MHPEETGGEQLRRARRRAERGRVGGQGCRSYFSLCVCAQSEEGLEVLVEGDYNILGRWVLCWSLCDCLV